MKKIAFTLILLALSTLAVLTAAEVMLRAIERRQMTALKDSEDKSVLPSAIPGLNYTLAPGPFKEDIVFNSHGFNMPERVAVRLHERAGDRFDVWNCGTGGYNARQVLIQMQHVLPPFRPDVIVYGFNFNDYWEPYQFFHGQPGLPPEKNVAVANEGWMDALKRYRVILKIRDLINNAMYHVRGYSPTYVDQKTAYPSWARMNSVISEVKNYCSENGIMFAVVIHPNEQFLYRDDEQNLAYADVRAHLDAEAIPSLDLLPALRPHRGQPIFLRDGNHMTAAGYDLVAHEVAGWILENPDLFRGPGAAAP